jgi:ferrous iron transport protein A
VTDVLTRNLTQMNEGESARVRSLQNPGPMKRRLQDLGLVEGTRVRCIQKSPYGDPVAYGFRGAVIALRKEDAMGVVVCDRAANRHG